MNARMQALDDWLSRANACQLWQKEINGVGTVAAYAIKGRVAIVQRFSKPLRDDSGWEIYVPASESGHIAETLDAAGRFFGVVGAASPDEAAGVY